MLRFLNFHPLILFYYFASMLVLAMFCTHPVINCITLLGALLFYLMLEKPAVFFKDIIFYICVFIVVAVTNPLFSHNGVTPLFFMNDNAITLEAFLYGVNMGIMLLSIIYWFKAFNRIMTSDKLLYLLGKVSPKLSLVVSSALRFVPLLRREAGRIRSSQKSMGLYSADNYPDRLRAGVRVYSALTTWSLENAIDTGSSMSARGYGLKGRSHFSLFKFTKDDGIMAVLITAMDIAVIIPLALGKLSFNFYPAVDSIALNGFTIPAYIAFLILSFIPFIVELKEQAAWKYYRSKI